MRLSILIPTTNSRLKVFANLIAYLYDITADGVEVLFIRDNKEISVGAKRQKLLEMAKGDYITFVDDDDWVSENYVTNILKAIETNPDCIGFKISCTGTPGVTASASNKWDDWGDNIGGFDYVRTIYHKNPIKRSIALQIGYKDLRFAEDYDYSKRLKESGLLKTEVFIDEVMYNYRFTYEDPTTKYGL